MNKKQKETIIQMAAFFTVTVIAVAMMCVCINSWCNGNINRAVVAAAAAVFDGVMAGIILYDDPNTEEDQEDEFPL